MNIWGYRCLSFLLLVWTTACTPATPPLNRSGLVAVTAVPTLDYTNSELLCETVREAWGRDWPAAIRALQGLRALNQTCNGGLQVDDQLYRAHIAYGTLLEQRGRRDEAIQAYRQALNYSLEGVEVVERLRRLGVVRALPAPPTCDSAQVSAALEALPIYEPSGASFVRLQDGQFVVDGRPWPVYGVNYYPRDYPEHRFLTEMDVESITFELDLIRFSGLNTLRIFLRHSALFICPGNGAVPVVSAFNRLDTFIQSAAERGFRLILVLNHDPDLVTFPLYAMPQFNAEQMAFIARRYSGEPAVMAYDVRDAGDADYDPGRPFTREQILNWLNEAANIIRENAPAQYVTAGWHHEPEVTAPLVDFVSFQHFGSIEGLRQQIAILRASTNRPILLAAVGYNTFDMDELGQRQAYQRAFEAASRNNLLGWAVWTAFDYPLNVLCADPNCPALDGPAVRFGLWNTSYFPKRALDAVEQATGAASSGNG